MKLLMSNKKQRNEMALQSISLSKRYELPIIIKLWEELICN